MSSPTLKLMESAMKRNVLQKINEVGHQKRLSERILSIKTVEKNGKNGSYAPLFLFLNYILGTFSSQSRAPVIETVSKQYKIGYTVEATIPSSYSNLFWAYLSNTSRCQYTPTKKSPGF